MVVNTVVTEFKDLAERVMLPNKKIKNVDVTGDGKVDGYQFDFVNPFYTAEPVSAIKSFELKVDGEEINPEKISLVVRDQRIKVKDSSTMYEVWMGFGEVNQIFVERTGGLEMGMHEVDCVLLLRSSAGNYGFGIMKLPVKVTMKVQN